MILSGLYFSHSFLSLSVCSVHATICVSLISSFMSSLYSIFLVFSFLYLSMRTSYSSSTFLLHQQVWVSVYSDSCSIGILSSCMCPFFIPSPFTPLGVVEIINFSFVAALLLAGKPLFARYVCIARGKVQIESDMEVLTK